MGSPTGGLVFVHVERATGHKCVPRTLEEAVPVAQVANARSLCVRALPCLQACRIEYRLLFITMEKFKGASSESELK